MFVNPYFSSLPSNFISPKQEFEEKNVNLDKIVLMQNFDPYQWEHLKINLNKIPELAEKLINDPNLKSANWVEILPKGLGIEQSVEYIVGLISIDFCHWDVIEGQKNNIICDFFTLDDDGKKVRGSVAMTALAKKAYSSGSILFDAFFMKKVTIDELRPYFMGFDQDDHPMEIPLLSERVKVMNEIGNILLEKWSGSFYNS